MLERNRFSKQGGSIHRNITADGELIISGRKVGSDGRLNGQVNGNIEIDRRTGLKAKVEGKEQANFSGQVGFSSNVKVSTDLKLYLGLENIVFLILV